MKHVILRPADPEQDFEQLAGWFSDLEGWTNTLAGLQAYYQKNLEQVTQRVAVAEPGELLGFYWATIERLQPEQATFNLYVIPDARRQGVGSRLYEDMLAAMQAAQVRRLRISIIDPPDEVRAFAERCGFVELRRSTLMALNLDELDDRSYDGLIARLEQEGFLFTSMEALGDGEGAQRKLYWLNETTGMDIPGTDGTPTWGSFEEFQEQVCRAKWYHPGGQKVVIDKASGEFVAMSAISRFDDYAYNLHTGVERRYRGRKLAQAVKVLALRYAREELGVQTVRTHHNARNLPMFAIDRKLGYVPLSDTVVLEKML